MRSIYDLRVLSAISFFCRLIRSFDALFFFEPMYSKIYYEFGQAWVNKLANYRATINNSIDRNLKYKKDNYEIIDVVKLVAV